jgi:hypothetical protein
MYVPCTVHQSRGGHKNSLINVLYIYSGICYRLMDGDPMQNAEMINNLLYEYNVNDDPEN